MLSPAAPARRTLGATALAIALLGSSVARAQAQPAQPTPPAGPRPGSGSNPLPPQRAPQGTSPVHLIQRPPVPAEQIVGYDPARNVLAYVERTPSTLAGFAHVALVEVGRDGNPVGRVAMTTETDVAQVRAAPEATREGVRAAIEARLTRDVDAARARFEPAQVFPVMPRGAVPSGPGGCQRAPYAPREFELGDPSALVRATPDPDGRSTTVLMVSGSRTGPATHVPSVTVSSGATTVQAAYDVVADARELPGGESYAVLLRSDACTPEGASVPARAVLLAAPPPPESALYGLTHAELPELTVMHVLAPRARRRVVDEVAGYFEGRAQVVFDNAWSLPSEEGEERVLVQYTRRGADLSPLLADAGEALANFAILARRGQGFRVVSQLAPPLQENVFEGTGQEAFSADLDGDGHSEVVIRAHYGHDEEIATVLRVSGGSAQFVWRGVTRRDERTLPNAGAQAEVRRCTLGLDAGTLVNRCALAIYRAGAAPDARPLSRGRLIQRVRWNGGMVELREERR